MTLTLTLTLDGVKVISACTIPVVSFRRSVMSRSNGGLKSQVVEDFGEKFVFKNDHVLGNFQNSVAKGFIISPVNVLCVNFVKVGRSEIRKVVCCLPDKK